MPWIGNAQRAKNVGITVTCVECNKPRCLYASKKITDDEKKIFMAYLDTICYACGATFAYHNKVESDDPKEESSRKRNREALEDDNVLSDVESEEEIEVSDEESIPLDDNDINTKRDDMDQELKNVLSKIFVNAALECYDEMEKPYYSANFPPICFSCGSPEYIIPVPEKQYPYCEACTKDPNIPIKTGKGLNFSSNSSERKGKRAKKN